MTAAVPLGQTGGTGSTRYQTMTRSALFGAILRDVAPMARAGLARRDPGDLVEKAARDYQTATDRAVEAAIVARLREALPHHRIEGEEFGATGATDPEAPLLLIDPIDGTTNFAWGLPHFGMVITEVAAGALTAGAILDPCMDELFTADLGCGAFLNGVAMAVRQTTDPQLALIGAGLPVPGQVQSVSEAAYTAALARCMAVTSGVRRLGSAALSTAYVAAGRLDGFFEDGLGLMDHGAGSLMVTEAGGTVSDFAGGPVRMRGGLVAGGPAMHGWLLAGLAG